MSKYLKSLRQTQEKYFKGYDRYQNHLKGKDKARMASNPHYIKHGTEAERVYLEGRG